MVKCEKREMNGRKDVKQKSNQDFDFENFQPFCMVNDSKIKTWILSKDPFKGTARRMVV